MTYPDPRPPAPGPSGSLSAARFRLAGAAVPLAGPARIYVCGITPYDVTHLGHAATFIWSDTLATVLRLAGTDVISCRNVTDVDEVLTRAADRQGEFYDVFAARHAADFEHDLARLGVRRPTYEPRARTQVPRVLQLVSALLQNDAAYRAGDTVFFRGAGLPDRVGLDVADARRLSAEYGDTSTGDDRAAEFDVPIWRATNDSGPSWASPWGSGRPGWHAECAAMALALLGSSIDVLAGGADLRFPHHAYQAAMVEAATGVTPFARAQLSVGTVAIGGAKMAKSTGNLVLVSALLREHSPSALRLLVLDRRWHEPWDFEPAQLAAAADRLDRLYAAMGRSGGSERAADAVADALLDDLDVPRALYLAEEAGGEAARLLVRTLSLH